MDEKEKIFAKHSLDNVIRSYNPEQVVSYLYDVYEAGCAVAFDVDWAVIGKIQSYKKIKQIIKVLKHRDNPNLGFTIYVMNLLYRRKEELLNSMDLICEN